MKRPKILIIEDEIIVAKGIESILVCSGYEVLEVATSSDKAKKILLTNSPDLVLCDINLNEAKDGIELSKEIQQTFNIPFMFISAQTDKKTLSEASKTYSLNFITKPFNEKQLLTAVNIAFAQIESNSITTPSKRELAVLQLIGQGYSSKQVAEALNISFHTIETHRKNLIKKYKVNSITELVCFATSKGWIKYANQ